MKYIPTGEVEFLTHCHTRTYMTLLCRHATGCNKVVARLLQPCYNVAYTA